MSLVLDAIVLESTPTFHLLPMEPKSTFHLPLISLF